MTTARSAIVTPGSPGYFHCVSRCVRRSFLCGDDKLTGRNFDNRRDWIVERKTELAQIPRSSRGLKPAINLMAAWVGLVPRQNGTGGKVQLGHITKAGDRQLRRQLIHGARTVLRWLDKQNALLKNWTAGIIDRRGKKRAIVAYANKLTRLAFRALTSEEALTSSAPSVRRRRSGRTKSMRSKAIV
jgi:hypothetical protein